MMGFQLNILNAKTNLTWLNDGFGHSGSLEMFSGWRCWNGPGLELDNFFCTCMYCTSTILRCFKWKKKVKTLINALIFIVTVNIHDYKTSSSTPVCSVLTLVMMLDCRLLKLSLRLKVP